MGQHTNFKCSKCSHDQCNIGEIRAAGGFWSKIFNVQARKFKTVSCSSCGFTEMYDGGKSGKGQNVLDFLTN